MPRQPQHPVRNHNLPQQPRQQHETIARDFGFQIIIPLPQHGIVPCLREGGLAEFPEIAPGLGKEIAGEEIGEAFA